MANANLSTAKKAKKDEFYTQYADIARGMEAYLDDDANAFRGKTVLLPCDDPEWSNFTRYFAENFERIDLADLKWDCLDGDGDFRSDEVKALRDEADIIVTITPATKPIIPDAWVRPGTHISCVGADMPGKQELASALVARAAVYVDDREQSVASGELEIPVAEGAITPEDIKTELGEVIAGTATGRSDDEQVTVFDTSGIAVQDLSASKIAYDRAVEAGLGTAVEL